MYFRHGDILFLEGSVEAAAPSTKPTHAITPRCQHGPRGMCHHCAGETSKESTLTCNHGSNSTCPNCANFSKQDDGPAEWLCNHADSTFCVKCLPPKDDDDDPMPSNCPCNQALGQKCVRCLKVAKTRKVNFVSYNKMMADKKTQCTTRHQKGLTCFTCAPPPIPDYKGKPNCNRGHKPWPIGVCLACAPSNAHLRQQKFRYTDIISISSKILQPFYMAWSGKKFAVQQAAILFGSYVEVPSTQEDAGPAEMECRAMVEAMYCPPQENLPGGVRFLVDKEESSVHQIAAALGMDCVGWVITTNPRAGDLYEGKVFLSCNEIRMAARFQNAYKNEHGQSRFSTVVMESGAQVEPFAYQVSDQCVALERDGVLADDKDPWLMSTKVPKNGELMPSIVYKNNPLLAGTPFLADAFIVNVTVTAPVNPVYKFAHFDFPTVNGTEMHLRSHLAEFSRLVS